MSVTRLLIDKICRFYLVAAVLVLAGCDNPYDYNQPASLSSQNAATLIGSRIQNQGLMTLDTLVMPSQIDGKVMGSQWYNDASSRWNEPFLISPGTHKILATISLGGTFNASAWGFANFDMSFQPGKTYHIVATTPMPISGSKFLLLAYAWLQDDSGNALTPRIPVQVAVYTGGDMIGLPSGGGEPQVLIPPHS